MMEESDLRIEEYLENGDMVIRAEMPGIDPEQDVDITVSDGTLHINAERRKEVKTEDKRGYRSEFHYGSFGRSVRLPAGVSEDDIEASYKEGILEVRAPIDTRSAESKKIPISRS
jgi:HSP20 family protein